MSNFPPGPPPFCSMKGNSVSLLLLPDSCISAYLFHFTFQHNKFIKYSSKSFHLLCKLNSHQCKSKSSTCAGIQRQCFGLQNTRFHQNSPKTLVFNQIRAQRRKFQLVLEEIGFGVVFQYGLRRSQKYFC